MKPSLASLGYGLPSGVTIVIAGVIFVATLALIMTRPRQLNEALAALTGGILMIAAGIVSPLQALQTLLGDWNIFLFFLGMLTLSALAERAGFFDWLAARAALLLVGALGWKQVQWKGLGKEISWSIFGFIAGMFIIVQGVENIGLTQQFARLLTNVAGANTLSATLVGTAGAAIGSNLINNLPMALVLVATIGALSGVAPDVRLALIGATIFGSDLGPNLTTVGSLATVLWLLLLRRRGMDISSLDYFKLGIIVTPLMLLVGALAMWLTLHLF